MSKRWTFYLHFNKPASLAAKRPLMSVHYRGKCHVVDRIVCNARSSSRLRNRQPRIVMAGTAPWVEVKRIDDAMVALIGD